jgi:hypothetical protein
VAIASSGEIVIQNSACMSLNFGREVREEQHAARGLRGCTHGSNQPCLLHESREASRTGNERYCLGLPGGRPVLLFAQVGSYGIPRFTRQYGRPGMGNDGSGFSSVTGSP